MGSRSASKVLVKRGNGRGTPWREERHRGTEPLEGKTTWTPICDTVYTQLLRIASRSQAVYPTSRMRQPARPDPWEARVGDHPGPPGKPRSAMGFAADPGVRPTRGRSTDSVLARWGRVSEEALAPLGVGRRGRQRRRRHGKRHAPGCRQDAVSEYGYGESLHRSVRAGGRLVDRACRGAAWLQRAGALA